MQEDRDIDRPDAENEIKVKENIKSALLKLDKAQFIINEIESTYHAIKDLDPEVYPEVAGKYKRVEALLNMLLDFVYAGKSDMDEIAEIIAGHRNHNKGENE